MSGSNPLHIAREPRARVHSRIAAKLRDGERFAVTGDRIGSLQLLLGVMQEVGGGVADPEGATLHVDRLLQVEHGKIPRRSLATTPMRWEVEVFPAELAPGHGQLIAEIVGTEAGRLLVYRPGATVDPALYAPIPDGQVTF